jgi:hypothetical protein
MIFFVVNDKNVLTRFSQNIRAFVHVDHFARSIVTQITESVTGCLSQQQLDRDAEPLRGFLPVLEDTDVDRRTSG